MNRCSDKAGKSGLAALTEVERTIFLASWANFEIELGGLSAFYYNSAGDYANETVAALQAIGASRAAAALRSANGLFPGGSPAKDREERFQGWQSLTQAAEDPLDALTGEFYGEEPDVFSRLCTYMEAHADELREYEPGI